MAMNTAVFALFLFTLALAKAEQTYTSNALKGSISCVDCPRGADLSEIQVLVKCDKVKKLAMTYTEKDGTFETRIPSDGKSSSTNPASFNCMAKIMGGPYQLYTSVNDAIVPIVTAKDGGHFSTSKPLTFYKSCPVKGARCDGKDVGFDSAKTVNVPLPREWGLAPSSYYVPFVPIIGIP